MNLSDEKLVAYLDGELDASESAALSDALARDARGRERLATLNDGGRAFAEAFDVMLDAAPEDKLRAMFAGLVAQTSGGASSNETVVPFRQPVKPQPQQTRHMPLWRMAAAAVLLAAVFAGGVISGGILNEPQRVAEQPGWREAAARYVAMFSKETLDGMPSDSAEKHANLAKAETALGLQLTESRVSAPSLDFRGTQLLNFNGKPLAQIAYLHGQTPVALCIIAAADGEPAAPANESRHGLNIVHWAAGGYGYMLIGDVPEDELNRIAERLRTQFS